MHPQYITVIDAKGVSSIMRSARAVQRAFRMGKFATAILNFSLRLPGTLGDRLREDWMREYFQEFARQPAHGADAVSPEARAVLSFLRNEAGVAFEREWGRAHGLPVFYFGIGQRWVRGVKGQMHIMGSGAERSLGHAMFTAAIEFVERFVLSVRSAGRSGDPFDFRAALARSAMFRPAGTVPVAAPFRHEAERVDWWVPGRSLFSGEEVLLPAQKVLWDPDLTERSGEPRICEQNTSGAAAGRTASDAKVFGICELVERDALLFHWLKKISPPRILPESVRDPEIDFLVEEARSRGLEPHLLDITTDIPVPAYMAVFVKKEPPTAFRGFSANLDPRSAMKRALYEAWGSYVFNTLLPNDLDDPILARYRVWLQPSSFRHFEFLLKGPIVNFARSVATGEKRGELEILLELFRARGPAYELYWHESRHPILERLGLHVGKAVSAGLIPLYFFEESAKFALSHPRLRGVKLNTYPHPFG